MTDLRTRGVKVGAQRKDPYEVPKYNVTVTNAAYAVYEVIADSEDAAAEAVLNKEGKIIDWWNEGSDTYRVTDVNEVHGLAD